MRRAAGVRGASLMVAMLFAVALPAFPQATRPGPFRRIEVEAGGGILGGAGLGSVAANLRANDPVRRPFRLFSTVSRIESARTLHLRAGFAFNRRIGVEGGLRVSHPEIRTSVSEDIEGAPPITIAGRVDQYDIDASVVIILSELSLGRRTVPFVVAGGGYLRQLHEGHALVEQGRIYHVGGGVKHWLLARAGSFISAAGVRADARLYVMAGGISFDGRLRPQGAISGSVFVTF